MPPMPPLNVRNNNPGNIREVGISWEGKTGSNQGFTTFSSPEMGLRAMAKQIYTNENRGKNTVASMVSTWAPPNENPTSSYITNVATRLGVDPNTPLQFQGNPNLTAALMQAIIQQEGGTTSSNYFNDKIFAGIQLANGEIDPNDIPRVEPDPGPGLDPQDDPFAEPGRPGGMNEDAFTPDINPSGNKVPFYEDNILNKYPNYMYIWKIHVVHPAEADKFEENIQKQRAVTIADQGVETEINIESVEQRMVLAFQKTDRNSIANEFQIRMSEPGGMTLFNRILFASKRLGIENHLKATYLLELNFVGYEDDGRAVSNIIGPYFYSCTLTNLDVQYRDGATAYVGSFIETSQDAYSKVNLHLKQDINFEASTFGEFLKTFQEKIQEQENRRLSISKNQAFPTVYILELEDEVSEWGDWEFGAVEGKDDFTRGISVSGNGKLKFSFPAGTSIVAGVATALYQTKNFQKLPIFEGGFAKENPEDGEARPEKLAQLTSWMKLDTSVTFDRYDFLMRHYQRFITYRVGQYVTPEVAHDPVSHLELYQDDALQKKRLQNIVKNGLIRKKFDYLYTGLNTEVLDLDINLSNTYYQLQALNHGALDFSDNLFSGLSGPNQEIADFISTIAELEKKLQNIKKDKVELEKKIKDLNNLSPDQRAGYDGNFSQEIQANKEALSMLNRAELNITQQIARTQDERAKAAEQFQTRTTKDSRLPKIARRYITQSDVVSTSSANRAHTQGQDFPLTFIPNQVNSKAVQGPDKGIGSSGSVMLGAVEINLNSMADLATMIITVRGDPYWLGRPKSAYAKRNEKGANYTRGGCNFFIDMNFPTYPDDDTGLMNIPEKDFSITGLYRVTQVQAMYNSGNFEMMLDSFRDINTNVGLVLEELTSGQIDLGDAKNLPDRYKKDEQGDGSSDGSETTTNTGPNSGEFATGTGTGNVTQSQSGIRDGAIDADILNILQTAGVNAGVDVVVISGSQPATGVDGVDRTGSHRHDNGRAADVAIYSGGVRLDTSNPNHLPIIQNFINEAKKSGATGIGAGNGYMGNNTFHIDRAYPERGYVQYWGGQLDNGTFRSRNAPQWLKEIAQGIA